MHREPDYRLPSIDNVTYMTNQAKTLRVAPTQFVGAADWASRPPGRNGRLGASRTRMGSTVGAKLILGASVFVRTGIRET